MCSVPTPGYVSFVIARRSTKKWNMALSQRSREFRAREDLAPACGLTSRLHVEARDSKMRRSERLLQSEDACSGAVLAQCPLAGGGDPLEPTRRLCRAGISEEVSLAIDVLRSILYPSGIRATPSMLSQPTAWARVWFAKDDDW